MKRRYHNLLFFITLGLAAVCAVLIPEVNVNSDMTKYLPDGSRMKQGLEILQDEFGEQHLPSADVRAMFRGLKENEVEAVADSLGALPNVDGVTATRSADGEYTLYELNVPKSIDQKTFGKEISRSPGRDVTVETSQDGNTPAASVMIIAASLILLILIMMAQSWLEPVIFGISTGLAIVLNIGTNALLPSVSITTNYIVAILQMVLSLDYSIVMMNRYRQEKHAAIATVEAANAAMRKAFPSIMSSALTTLVGLLMLVFMRLKIGMDMGIVLAKGVLCSLVCTFTVLPTLLMVFHKGVMNTGKWTFVLPTDRLSRFVTRHKLPLAIFAVGLFFCAFFLSRKTDISFANVNESEIDHIFPRKNIMTLLYPTDMEKGMFAVSDSLLAEDGVEAVISYPTLMMKEYGAEEMTMQLKTLAAEMPSSETPITETTDTELTDTELTDTRTMTSRMPSTEMLTPEMMRIIYYLKFQDDPQTRISFPDLSEFIMKNCVGNPLFADVIDEPMREKLELMAAMTGLEVIDKSADRTEVSGAGTGAGA
ncbi:MAG: MMPL family transporter, partial [Bacteroidales bacterium]|nr:MMPL family transporter [Bacteroidales bacterium]